MEAIIEKHMRKAEAAPTEELKSLCVQMASVEIKTYLINALLGDGKVAKSWNQMADLMDRINKL